MRKKIFRIYHKKEKDEVKVMPSIQPIQGVSAGYSTMNTARNRADDSHAYIASRINDLYIQALRRQSDSSVRTLKQFVDSNPNDGKKLHRVV